MDELWPIGEVAALAHVSVRTLHHYDDIGLLTPSARTAAGHRRYHVADLARLREIRYWRELGFGLGEVAALLADTEQGADDRLREQHRLLRTRIDRDQQLLAALTKEMEARDMGISLTPEEQFEIFGPDYSADYAAEAEQRWGDTPAWEQSQARTATFTKQDWIEIKQATDANEAGFAAALHDGAALDSDRVRALAEQHRAGISRFWDCSHEAHRCLAQMYVDDPRFRQHYEDVAPGLAQYVRDAINANADAEADAS